MDVLLRFFFCFCFYIQLSSLETTLRDVSHRQRLLEEEIDKDRLKERFICVL